MEKSVSERLRQFLEVRKISQGELARRFGVTKQTVNGWCTGATLISTKHLIEISEAWPELDMDWLITGRYTMFVDDKKTVLYKETDFSTSTVSEYCVACEVKKGIISTLEKNLTQKDETIQKLSERIGQLNPLKKSLTDPFKNLYVQSQNPAQST